MDYLTSAAVALVDPTQVDATYDGTTAGFLADGGRLADLAVTPVLPRATCHACTPDP